MTLCINLQRTFRGFAAICGATVAFGGATALTNTAFAQTPAPAAPAAPAAAPASTATPWTYQGLFDAYYLYDGNSPTGPKGDGTASVTGFDYDTRASTPTLALAELNIAKAVPANGGLGFKTTLIAGDTADLNAPGTQEARYKNIQQLYITLQSKTGYGVNIGKFYTPFGYEVTESNANLNYSRSWIFTELLPVYHTGLAIFTPSYKGLVLTGYVVKAINNDDEGVYDANKDLGFIGQLNYTAPSGKYTAIETYGASTDGPKGSYDKLKLSDFDLTLTPTAVDTIGFNWTNRQDRISFPAVFDSSAAGSYSGYANGYAGYYKRQLSATYALALRAEEIQVKSNGQSPRIDSLTATLSDQTTKSLLVRLEFRHDDAKTTSGTSTVSFGGFYGHDGGTVATQNTLSLSGVYTFGP